MDSCPDCTQVKQQAKNDPRFQIIDIGEHVHYLKEFLRLRDNSPAFDLAKANGWVGIPCFLLEDGSIHFSLDGINIDEGRSCSLDGKGC